MKKSTYISPEGPLDARVILIGDFPWISDVAAGRPFSGSPGNALKYWWASAEGKIGNFVINGMEDNYSSFKPIDPTELVRPNIYLTNLIPFKPPAKAIESVGAEKIIQAIESLHRQIAELKDPYVIVTMGNYATFALTGKGKVNARVRNAFTALGYDQNASEAEKKAGITQLRGSVYPYRDLNGRMIKVIPMIPADLVLMMPKWVKRSISDWKKVKREVGYKEIQDPGRRHIIDPTQQQIEEYCQEVYKGGSGLKMALDIETWGHQLNCVGFAYKPFESITIPTMRENKWTIPYVKWLCECEAQKILANGSYDWYWLDAEGVSKDRWLWERGIGLRNYLWDTQAMHHCMDPAESHSLDFVASMYCPHYVFWKDEAKEAEEIIKYAKDANSLWTYNGLDCCYTRELVDYLEKELIDLGMLDFYFRHYQAMFEPLLKTMRHGFRVDVDAQKAARKRLAGELKELHEKLNELAGEELFATEEKTKLRKTTKEEWFLLLNDKWADEGLELDEDNPPKGKYIDRDARDALITDGKTYMIGGKNAGMMRVKVVKIKKSFSKDKLFKFFHETIGLPKQYKMRKTKKGRERTESLDEDSIRKLMYKYKKAEEPGNLLLQYREKEREIGYLKGAWDGDGRMRCSYKMNTKAGRLASSKNPMRTGYNLQNLKR